MPSSRASRFVARTLPGAHGLPPTTTGPGGNEPERRWVDDYHEEVLRVVAPQLDGDAKAWLEAQCAPL